jgi:predicted secreted hydrolase
MNINNIIILIIFFIKYGNSTSTTSSSPSSTTKTTITGTTSNNTNSKELRIELPKDDSFIPIEEVQWWYWTGHLRDNKNNKYGYEMCFFIVLGYSQLLQIAITDVNNNKFSYTENFEFSMPLKEDDHFELVSTNPNVGFAIGGNGQDHLSFNLNEYSLNITLTSIKDPVLHYNGLPHHYSFGIYKLLYNHFNYILLSLLSS